jgi:hypothetical protein
MKKTYIKPSNEVYSISTTEGILVSGSNPEGFNPSIGGEGEGDGGDYGREDNTPSRPNIWEQGW